MWNTAFVTVHATAATVAFVVGILAVPAGRYLAVYRTALVAMAVALLGAVFGDWGSTDVAARIVFSGLLILAAVMVVRGELAWRRRPSVTGGPTAGYVEHVGFTLISLAVGFTVVTVVRLGAPGWLVGVLGVAVVLTGRRLVGAARRRLPARPQSTACAAH